MSTSPNPLRLPAIDYEAIENVTPEQEAHARACIGRLALDEADRQALMGVVFGQLRVRPPRGTRREAEATP